ncbi:MAG: wax ester/triacylglycerol synthase family O-acyltransferase [Pseudomonadota bacterium]
MNHLSGMDASFLYIESPEMPMHVGGLQLLDLPQGYAGDFYEDVKRYLGSRLHMAEVFRRKLELMPFELANPVWVDVNNVELEYHVRRAMLPRPGTWQQLETYVARLHSSLLDRSRPLWELYVIEGLESGQVAIYSKLHHAAIDGQAGVEVSKAMLTISPEPETVKAPRPNHHAHRARLGIAEMAGAAIGNAFEQYVNLVKALPATARAIGSVLAPVSEQDGKRHLLSLKKRESAPKTPLNVAVTNQRTFAARSLPLAQIKLMARRSGASLNDIVMAICAGALKRCLADYNCVPAKALVAAVPVSLREAGNTDANNQVGMMLVRLATDIDDPIERLNAIRESSSAGKQFTGGIKAAIPGDFPSFGAPWFMSGLASLYGRSGLAGRLPPMANVTISNVPGPQFPLYFAGAKLASWYPVSIPVHGVALNVTVQSYNGSLEVGLTACRRAMPDLADLGDYVVEEQRMLLALINSQEAVAPVLVQNQEPQPEPAPAVTRRRATPRLPVKTAGTPDVAPARKSAAAVKPKKTVSPEVKSGEAVAPAARTGAARKTAKRAATVKPAIKVLRSGTNGAGKVERKKKPDPVSKSVPVAAVLADAEQVRST